MKHFKLITLVAFIASLPLQAQQNFSLYPMRGIPQSNLLNPANTPDCKWHLGIPALNSNYLHVSAGGFSINRILDATEPLNGDTLTLNLNKVMDIMSKRNYIAMKGEISWLSGGFKMGNHYFHGSITEKASVRVSLPKDLLRFVVDGNGGSNLGETFNFNFKLDAIHYREYAVGYAYNLDDKIKLGARVKYLQGFSVIQTKKLEMNLTTNKENYNYLLQPAIDVNMASNLGEIIPLDSNSNGDFDFKNMLLKTKNRGMAIDLGASVKLNEKLTVSGSILDMGFIHWNTNSINLRSHNPNATYEFDGIYINGKDTSSDFGQYFQRIADTIVSLFSPDTTQASFNSGLGTDFMISGQYELNNKMSLGALFYGDFYNKRFYPGLTLNFMIKPVQFFTLNLTNTIYNRGFINPGIATSFNIGPYQIYGCMDNFLAPFALSSMRSFSIRAGMNLTFGREGARKRRLDRDDQDIAPAITPSSEGS